jgi:AcrR family transcriptional regulator
MSATKRKGTTDPARTIAALWGIAPPPRRGPKHTLTIAQVVAAAIGLANKEQDLSLLSMRRVAESLGVGTMSLYTYIASRDALLEVMLDTAHGEVVVELETRPEDEDWPDGLRRVAKANWNLVMRHPWVLQIFTGRPPLGPNTAAKYDLELSVIDGIGLDDIEMDAVITLVQTHVHGVAHARVEADRMVRQTGLTDEQWWELAAPSLAEVIDPSCYPIGSRVGQAAGQVHHSAHNPEHAYAFGLERLIDGIKTLITTRN